MRFPWSKKEQPVKEKKTSEDPELKKLRETGNNLSLIMKHRVTRFDKTEAHVKALVELHLSEVKEHPAVLDFYKREEEYEKEKAQQN